MNRPRVRSKIRAICPCCNSPYRWLYPTRTILGIRLRCAECCRNTYGVQPGYTTDARRVVKQGEAHKVCIYPGGKMKENA